MLLLFVSTPVARGQCDSNWSVVGAEGGDQLGWDIAGLGDLDGDGHSELLVGSYLNDDAGENAGAAFVYSGLTGEILYEYFGEATEDHFGAAVASAGDVNADGIGDFIIGAYRNDDGGQNAGKAYLYSGLTGALIATFVGEAEFDNFGYSVDGAGDVNNDGHDDLIIGARFNDAGGDNAGRAYVLSGWGGARLMTITGLAAGDELGQDVSGAGDVNGDGWDDVIVGARLHAAGGLTEAGTAYVYSGRLKNLLYVFNGEAALDRMGAAVSEAGDVDNDGYDDVMVGATRHDPGGIVDAGRAYVFSGLTGGTIWTFDGEASTDFLGSAVAAAGDLDADGFDDVIIGAFRNDEAAPGAGKIYLVSGQTGSVIRTHLGTAQAGWLGRHVSRAGDVDGDGTEDIITGAPLKAGRIVEAGEAVVFSGASGLALQTWNGGGRGSYYLGTSVSGAGDFDGDGFDDILISSDLYNYGHIEVRSGATFGVIFSLDGDAASARLGQSAAGAGDVNGDGLDDIIVVAGHLESGDTARIHVFGGPDGTPLWTFYRETAHQSSTYGGLEFVTGGGDVNSDGYDDLIVGFAHQYEYGVSDTGAVKVFSGLTGDLLWAFPGSTDNSLYARWDYFGYAGDVNNDGFGDVAVIDPEDWSTRVYSGETGEVIWNIPKIVGAEQLLSVAGVGDVNRDGHDDFIIGAYAAPLCNCGWAGRADVYSGLDASVLWSFTDSRAGGGRFGSSVSGAGDLDGDGYDDILIGKPGELSVGDPDFGTGHGAQRGYAFAYSGRTGELLWSGSGVELDHLYGQSLSGAGDLNGDGAADILIGAPYYWEGTFARKGAAYVYTCTQCACSCHGDPACDGVTNVLDVVHATGVAFRGTSPESGGGCPDARTDVNCDGVTNVLDVVKFTNVAFRGADRAVEFCIPCP